MASVLRTLRPLRATCARCSSTLTATSPAPPLLLKLRRDLKTAMKEKDTTRLNVLRALLADVTNASKTSKPMRTDVELLSLLRKRAAAAKSAVEEFQSASRSDLVEKEQAQVQVLEEYASDVQTVGADEIRAAVDAAAERLKSSTGKLDQGSLLKSLIGPAGVFEGKPVEKVEVVKAVKEYMS